MTKEEGVILSAYTGYLLVDDFGAVHEFIEKLLGRPVWTHQLADPAIQEEIRRECKMILPDVSDEDNHWIPVTEQLPKTDGRFMVTIKGKSGKPHVEMRNFHAGAQKWENQYNWPADENILAWKARPRPYGVKPSQADTELSGHWIYWDGWCGNHDRRIDDATCSVCGYKHPTVRATKEEWDTRKFLSDTCPGCGAKMKKGGACNAVV